MEKQVLIVSLVAGFLGLFSVILGFTAEVTKINASDVYIYDFGCVYPNSPALGLAIGAALFLVLAQIIVTAFGGCCGCCKKDPAVPAVTGSKRTLTLIFIIISWITFAISIILFIVGADKNGTGGQTTSLDACYVVKPGIFAGAAICALATMCLSISAYIVASPPTTTAAGAPAKANGVQYADGVVMGTPQFPPTQPQYPAPGVGGTQYPAPGIGGTQVPAPGTGGTQYPPPGTNNYDV
ncbi:hypothetical protein LUZ62_057774 [Rhynchospora pubera]|uniref:Uncharacterized protein n=1 Tax=Rhynchospora pubera TaxID=906938 RepID=A0AAV8E430_9POAL|nr:hypothetical protein LUZ62_057774 [Rhynchospora pubera]